MEVTKLQANLSTTAIFLCLVHAYCMCTIIMLIQSYIMYRYKMHKNLNYVLNQNVNVTKQARFATFAITMLDNFCLLQQYK